MVMPCGNLRSQLHAAKKSSGWNRMQKAMCTVIWEAKGCPIIESCGSNTTVARYTPLRTFTTSTASGMTTESKTLNCGQRPNQLANALKTSSLGWWRTTPN